MTREQKLEAMARAWCEFNGWLPDHRPTVRMHKLGAKGFLADGSLRDAIMIVEDEGEPTWKAHVKAMDHILKAIGE